MLVNQPTENEYSHRRVCKFDAVVEMVDGCLVLDLTHHQHSSVATNDT